MGGFLCIHLATNATILDGPETFQHRVDQIHNLGATTLLLLEWGFIFVPILFHGLIGLVIVSRGKRNLGDYPYAENWRYTLQRASGVVAFIFILWHVFHMHGWLRFAWWTDVIARPLGGAQFDPENAISAAAVIQASPVVLVLYTLGIVACVYHLANGLWTIGITWGVWTSTNSQRRANLPCAALGLFLGIAGLGALVGMQTTQLPENGVKGQRAEARSRMSENPLQQMPPETLPREDQDQ